MGANLHPGANCAHERKLYNFYTLWWEISINVRCFLLRCCFKSIKNKCQVVFYRNEYHVYYFNHSSIRYLNMYGYHRSSPPTHTFSESKHQGGISVGSVSALYANSPKYSTSRPSFVDFSLQRLLNKSKLSVTGQKNGH